MRSGVRRALALVPPVLALVGCSEDATGGSLPAGPAPVVSRSASRALETPPPVDDRAAVVDADGGRTVSPAQGTVTLTVRGAVPGEAAGQAYLRWVRSSLTAFARPGEDDGGVERFAAPAVVRDVQERVRQLVQRGWAEYGSASVSGMTVRVSGSSAAVSACLDLSGLATRDVAGRLAGRDGPVRSTATLALSVGRWQVTGDRRTALGRCP